MLQKKIKEKKKSKHVLPAAQLCSCIYPANLSRSTFSFTRKL